MTDILLDDTDETPGPPQPPFVESQTLEITPTRRRSEYSFDVCVNGLWVASAKNYHAADDVACLIWQSTKARIIANVLERIGAQS